MNRLSVRTTRNLLAPGWIATFGFVVRSAPPLAVAARLSLFLFHIACWREALRG